MSESVNKKWNTFFPYLLLLPAFLYLLTILFAPFIWGIGLSFTDKQIGKSFNFSGLKNYISLLQDQVFLLSIKNTFVYTIISVAFKVLFGVIMALVLNTGIRFRSISRGLLLIPWAVPTVVSIFTWKWMFSDVGGVLNTILLNTGLVSNKITWLSTPAMAMLSVILVNVWRGMPFIGISVLAGLQTIPRDLYEAGTVDGANSLQKLFYITLPSIKYVILLSTLVTTIWTFNDFEIIWLLTKGGPINTTQLISTYSYMTGILNMNLGKAIAASALFMPVMLILINFVTSATLKEK